MRKFLLFLVFMSVGVGSIFSYFSRDTILGEVRFNSSGASSLKNLTFIPDWRQGYSNGNTFSGPGGALPYGSVNVYFNGESAGDMYKYAKLSFSTTAISQTQAISFWANRLAPSGRTYDFPFYNQNGIQLKFLNSRAVGIYFDGEKVGEFDITDTWHFYTIVLDKDSKKIKFYVDGGTRSFVFNTNKTQLLANSEMIVFHNIGITRIFSSQLSVNEINLLANEATNIKPSLVIGGSGSIFTFQNQVENFQIPLGKAYDTNSSIVDIEYSLNGSEFIKFPLVLDKPNGQDVSLNLPSNLFFQGSNTLSIRLYDGLVNSEVFQYSINKNFITDTAVSTGTLVGNFHFLNNISNQVSGHTMTLAGNVNYNKSFTFPQNSITFPDGTSSLTYNATNVETLTFFTKGAGEILNNTYFNLNYDTINGFGLNRGASRFLNVGPKDNNWHYVVLILDKVEDRLYIDIDGGKHTGEILYYRDDLMGNMKFKVGSFAYVKTFSNKLSSQNIKDLFQFYNLYIPVISSTQTGITMKTVDNFLTLPINVNDNDLYQNIEYFYSFDNSNFTKIDGISGVSPLSGVQNTLMPGHLIPTGQNTIYVKVWDGKNFSNVLNFHITKNSSTLDISIDETGLYKGGDKILKASINGGNLFYAITKEQKCDDTLNFLPYKELIFSTPEENGSYVCYKGVYFDETTYKLSREINGIGDKTTTVKNSDIFYNYLSWKKGPIRDFDPLYILITSQVSNSIQGSTVTRNYPKLLTDVNGDGLPDLILTNYISQQRLQYPAGGGAPAAYYEPQYYYALLLNKGNMDYEVKYRCVYIENATLGTTGFYGDCAQ